MRRYILTLAASSLALALMWSGAADGQGAQRAQRAQQEGQRPLPAANDVTLVYEREVFMYRGAGRPDPFRPLTEDDELGPRFERLTLQGVIYSSPRTSVALLSDGTGRVYRVRQGDVLGNARVLDIGPRRVVMAVDVFGTIRRETLELQRSGGDRR